MVDPGASGIRIYETLFGIMFPLTLALCQGSLSGTTKHWDRSGWLITCASWSPGSARPLRRHHSPGRPSRTGDSYAATPLSTTPSMTTPATSAQRSSPIRGHVPTEAGVSRKRTLPLPIRRFCRRTKLRRKPTRAGAPHALQCRGSARICGNEMLTTRIPSAVRVELQHAKT